MYIKSAQVVVERVVASKVARGEGATREAARHRRGERGSPRRGSGDSRRTPFMSDGAASGSSLAVLLATAPLGRGDGAEQRGGGVAYAAEIGPRSTRD